MKSIILLKELEKYKVFNNKIVRNIIKKDHNYTRLLIYRLKKSNLIIEIEKNKYTVHEDPLIIADSMVWPSYLSCWTALRFHNLTEQLPNTIFVITTRARKNNKIVFKNNKIIFIKVKQKYFFGYNKENYRGYDTFIADPEKAIIDSALFKRISLSELYTIIKNNLNSINAALFIDYLLRIKNKTLIKRFGTLFDKLRLDFYDKLKSFINNKYIILDYALPKNKNRNRKWKVIENVRY